MKADQLFIPEKIRVGFNNRDDTYTGKLAYVIYYDKKGVLRKQGSWESWRSKKIEPLDFDNTPTEGFVLNKGVGGVKQSYSWNARVEKIRTYDPRNFEFEISIPNALFILRECNCSKGKGLEGKFVYAWKGAELILLPVDCEEYRASSSFTELQGQSVKSKELTPGATYVTKRQVKLIYLGVFDYYFSVAHDGKISKADAKGVIKRKVFWDIEKKGIVYPDVAQIGALVTADATPDFSNLVEKYNKSMHSSKVIRLFLQEAKPKGKRYDNHLQWFFEENGRFYECYTNMEYHDKTKISHFTIYGSVYIGMNGILRFDNKYDTIYPPHSSNAGHHSGYGYRDYSYRNTHKWREPTKNQLFAELENGRIIQCSTANFSKE